MEEEKVFDLVLVDIWDTDDDAIKCVKRNMYDPNLKYIALSYQWGDMYEQPVETPDYTAHITSFHLNDLRLLCKYIRYEPDLGEIDYLWIDAISVNQQNENEKQEIILKMNQIYKNASYILAVPDLHWVHLWNGGEINRKILDLIEQKYDAIIYKEILHNNHSSHHLIHQQYMNNNKNNNNNSNSDTDQYLLLQKLTSKNLIKKKDQLKKEMDQLKKEKDELIMEMKKKEKEHNEMEPKLKETKLKQESNELKNAYQFLAHLIDDWSNHACIISEDHVAKEKYMNQGTPLKYMFLSLLNPILMFEPFFSYHFKYNDTDNDTDNDDQQQQYTAVNNKMLAYINVNDSRTFHLFLKNKIGYNDPI
ncbi:unnamed protein product [Cunninghamella blakesleeana]